MRRWMRITGFIVVVVVVFLFCLARDNFTMFFTVFVPMTIGMILINRRKARSLPRLDEACAESGTEDPSGNGAGTDRSPNGRP